MNVMNVYYTEGGCGVLFVVMVFCVTGFTASLGCVLGIQL